MDINLIVNITSRAWALSILTQMHRGVAGRQAPLLKATGASRTAFAQSMKHLIDIDLVERNPGYGHPLRPEFRLTLQGIAAAELAHRIQSVSDTRDLDLLRLSWTLPVLTVIHRPKHFNEIKRNLASITDRALSKSLSAMEERSWVSRNVEEDARPPRSLYSAINAGGAISQVTASEISMPS